MENHNTHLAPAFTLNDLVLAPVNVAIYWGLLGPRGLQQSLPNVLPAVEPLFPVWPKNLLDPTLCLGIHLPTRTPPGMELRSCSLCAPLVYSINGT